MYQTNKPSTLNLCNVISPQNKKAEVGVIWLLIGGPQAKEFEQPLEAEKGKEMDSPPDPSKGLTLIINLIWKLQTSKMVR